MKRELVCRRASVSAKRLSPLLLVLRVPILVSRLAEYMEWKSDEWALKVTKHRRKIFQVLVYHRVSPFADGIFDPIDPMVFETQIAYLAGHYTILTAGEAWYRAQHGTLPRGAVAITFDDGYRDNYEYAFPVLRKFGVPATLFLSTGPLDGYGPLWHDRMFTAFAYTAVRHWLFRGDTYRLERMSDRQKAVQLFAGYIRTLEEEERETQLARLCEDLRVSPDEASERSPMLTWDQVREMARWGIEIGSHTVTHPILSRLPEARQREEIKGSIARIHESIGIRPSLFAYPNGHEEDFTNHTIEILQDCNVDAAFSTDFGTNMGGHNPYHLRRGAAWDRDISMFSLQMAWYRMVA